jgi:putative transposase
MVKTVRQLLPRSGARKLKDIMSYSLNNRGIYIGRDRLFKMLKDAQLLVPRRKRHFFTTNSKHMFYKYPNKAKDLILTKPEQLWVSDITYIKTKQGNLYLSLITDAFSRKIMGHHLADHLKATGPIEALKMAIKNRSYPNRKLMHHSDKGIQYCCDAYIKTLTDNEIDISMTSKYDPYENAKAERINGTIKNEFELDKPLPDFTYAKREINKTVRIYNTLRPHLSCAMNTPEAAHLNPNSYPIKLNTNKLWETILFNNFNSN